MTVLIINLVFLLISLMVIKGGDFQKPSFIVYWGGVIIFVCPINYIYFGGESYRHFGDEAYQLYEYLALISILSIGFFYILKSLFPKFKNNDDNFTFRKSKIIDYFSIFFLSISVIYFLIYINHWPLLEAFTGVIEARPDIVKGVFKGYFMMSIVFQVILPAILFYYWQSKHISKNNIYFLFVVVSFFIIIGGNKGIYLYFIIFIFLTIIKRVNIKWLLFSLLVMIFLYAKMKGVNFDYDTLKSYLLESIFRRVFVTQGMGIPNSIQMMLNGIDFSLYNTHDLKFAIFEYIYGYSPGSMPLYFTGELFIRYGFLSVIVFSVFFSIFGALIVSKCESYKYYSINWLLYYALYVFVMSGVSVSNLYRLIVIIVMIIFFATYIKCELNYKSEVENGACFNNNTKL